MNVITVLEQEHGTELDLVQTQHLFAMERKSNNFTPNLDNLGVFAKLRIL